MRIGIYVYAIASAAVGILDLLWGELEPAHQPLQAWGDHIPGTTIFAYIAAVWLIAGGAAMLWQRSRRFGAATLTILYGIFVLFPLPRLYTAPHFLGYRAAVYLSVMVTVCQQIILVVAAPIVWKSLDARSSLSQRPGVIARWIFGLCSVDFGLAHLADIGATAPMVPKWMPLGGALWTVFTGTAFALAGLAIISGIRDVLAAWLLGWMLLVFSVLVLTPTILAVPHDHTTWGGNAYNLTAVGAAWIVAEWMAAGRQLVQNGQSAMSHTTKTRQIAP